MGRIGEWFADRLSEQAAAHDGDAMRASADCVLRLLPDGPIELVATSTEGCALAAVVAALRPEAPTRWRRLVFGRAVDTTPGFAVVVVEAVELGEGLREAIRQALPDAMIIAGVARRAPVLAA
jgi:hypothetical protein